MLPTTMLETMLPQANINVGLTNLANFVNQGGLANVVLAC